MRYHPVTPNSPGNIKTGRLANIFWLFLFILLSTSFLSFFFFFTFFSSYLLNCWVSICKLLTLKIPSLSVVICTSSWKSKIRASSDQRYLLDQFTSPPRGKNKWKWCVFKEVPPSPQSSNPRTMKIVCQSFPSCLSYQARLVADLQSWFVRPPGVLESREWNQWRVNGFKRAVHFAPLHL